MRRREVLVTSGQGAVLDPDPFVRLVLDFLVQTRAQCVCGADTAALFHGLDRRDGSAGVSTQSLHVHIVSSACG